MLGYNAPFTPCYYDGSAWCVIEWNPQKTATQVPDLNTLMSELTASYIRYKGWQPSGSVAGGGFQVGENINTNANQVSSSIAPPSLLSAKLSALAVPFPSSSVLESSRCSCRCCWCGSWGGLPPLS